MRASSKRVTIERGFFAVLLWYVSLLDDRTKGREPRFYVQMEKISEIITLLLLKNTLMKLQHDFGFMCKENITMVSDTMENGKGQQQKSTGYIQITVSVAET